MNILFIVVCHGMSCSDPISTVLSNSAFFSIRSYMAKDFSLPWNMFSRTLSFQLSLFVPAIGSVSRSKK